MLYTAGTVSIETGSTAVVGLGTSWGAFEGDRLYFGADRTTPYWVAAVNSATSITLDRPFADATIEGGAYALEPTSPLRSSGATVSAKVIELLARFGAIFGLDASKILTLEMEDDGNFSAIVMRTAAGARWRFGMLGSGDFTLERSANGETYATSLLINRATGVWTVNGQSGFGEQGPAGAKGDKGDKGDRGDDFVPSAQGTLEGRAAYDATPPPFSYLVLASNTVYFREEAEGEWSAGLNFGVGPKGDKGDTGDAGAKGDTGDQGPRGYTGLQGLKGDKGDKGDTGERGLDFWPSAVGPLAGRDAYDAEDPPFAYLAADTNQVSFREGAPGGWSAHINFGKGVKGDPGDTGPQGDKGDTGDAGAKGDTGDQGPQGEPGEKGDKGDKGDTGDTGPQGEKGDPASPYAPDAVGPEADRGAHDAAAPPFSYLANDTGKTYWKLSAAAGDWSPGVILLQGPEGPEGPPGEAPLESPAFTGEPTAPTQPDGDTSTKLATTAFAKTAASYAKACTGVAFDHVLSARTSTTLGHMCDALYYTKQCPGESVLQVHMDVYGYTNSSDGGNDTRGSVICEFLLGSTWTTYGLARGVGGLRLHNATAAAQGFYFDRHFTMTLTADHMVDANTWAVAIQGCVLVNGATISIQAVVVAFTEIPI